MIRFDILTLFPEMCNMVLSESIIGRARKNNLIEIFCHQIRDFSFDKHHRVDDTVYGPGMGMLMMAEPIARCFESLCENLKKRPKLIYMSPQGKTLTQEKVIELSKYSNIAILCGHYEGVDERFIESFVDEEISIGDYVLTGGELPALILVDAVTRLVDGVLSNRECFEDESFFNGLLEYPQYTKPSVWRGRAVPEILLSGHHKNISQWRKEQSLQRTKSRRPDLLLNCHFEQKEKYH